MHTSLSLIQTLAVLLTACQPIVPVAGYETDSRPSAAAVGTAGSTAPAAAQPAGETVLLFGIGMHIEPQGETAQGYRSGKGDYSNPDYFDRHVNDIKRVAEIVEKHGGVMTVQAQSPFTAIAIQEEEPILYELAASGHEIALHFHEDAHLGKNSQQKSVQVWCDVMKEEITLVERAAASPQGDNISGIRYWSGGNLYPSVFEAAACAGLTINSDWKNPKTQTTDPSLMGVHPWRPAGGTEGSDFALLTAHDPSGDVIFLPEGMVRRDKSKSAIMSEGTNGDEAYFAYLEESLMDSLKTVEAGEVNVFHFTIHPGEFRGQPDHPFDVIDRFLTTVVDPLVASGEVQWATFSEMADDYSAWETAHPGDDMR